MGIYGRAVVDNLKAKVAVARKLAVILHRVWIDGTEFNWSKEIGAESMIRKSGNRFSEKIMLKQRDEIMMRFDREGITEFLPNGRKGRPSREDLTPSCGGFPPTAERTVGPARTIVGELDTQTPTTDV